MGRLRKTHAAGLPLCFCDCCRIILLHLSLKNEVWLNFLIVAFFSDLLIGFLLINEYLLYSKCSI